MLLLGLIEVPLWLLLTITILATLYWLGTRNHDHFKKQGIPGPNPVPFLGTAHKFFTMDLYTMHLKMKQQYGKTYGLMSGSNPEYVIFDEEMISQVTVKQFQNFQDRRDKAMGEPAFDSMLTVLKGDHWKHVRSQMSPAFTTGKLRTMSDEINRSGQTLAKRLISTNGPFEAGACAGAFTMDVIASSGFGLRVNSQEDENNTFFKNGRKMLDFDMQSWKLILFFLCPKAIPYLTKLGMEILNKSAVDFFMQVIDQTLKGRTDDGNKARADFIQLMVKAKQGQDIRDKEKETGTMEKSASKDSGLNKAEILSNALLFFIAGFDTTSVAVGQLMYLLACNQDRQQTLIEELDNVLGDKETVDYDSTMKMHYLDQCIQETLRIYPPAFMVDREAKVDTEVCGMKIKKGTVVVIPIIGIHHDPEIWADPERFDPDRFSPENKAKMSPFHWMPFGYGPRNCIGMRLALFEIKVAIATVLRTHKLVTCEKTEIPLKMSKSKIMKAENGIWLAVEKRTDV